MKGLDGNSYVVQAELSVVLGSALLRFQAVPLIRSWSDWAFWERVERTKAMIKRVLVALDGSDHANKAFDLACEMASRFGAELLAVHVIADKPLSDAERSMVEAEFQSEGAKDFSFRPSIGAASDMRLESQQLIKQAAETRGRLRWALGERLKSDACARANKKAVQTVRTVTRVGDPAKQILSVANEENADIIVMGRRGLGDLAGLLLGSVSHKVSQLAECACLTVK
jgi:nucleotide-binding universal stress UspA family protein